MRGNDGKFERSLVYGHGEFDLEGTTQSFGKSYTVWRSMLARCYSQKYQSKQKTYRGSEVCQDWKLFSIFHKWFNDNYVEGWELDKDLLGDGKTYSPESCCFIPKQLNLSLPKVNTTSNTITGVVLREYGKYTCQVRLETGEIKHLGTFLCQETAFSVYKREKERIIAALANTYKSRLDSKVYQKLVEIDLDKFVHKLLPGENKNGSY